MTFDRAHPPPNDDPTMLPWVEHWIEEHGQLVFNGWYRWGMPEPTEVSLNWIEVRT